MSPTDMPLISLSSVMTTGDPVVSAGMMSMLWSLTTRSSSLALFLLASWSVMITGISSPEFHVSSTGCMSTVAKSKPITMSVSLSL